MGGGGQGLKAKLTTGRRDVVARCLGNVGMGGGLCGTGGILRWGGNIVYSSESSVVAGGKSLSRASMDK